MKTTKRYWTLGTIGIGLTALVGGLAAFSLEDWDFYYRLTSGIGLNVPEGPLLSRVVWACKWTLMIPTLALGGALAWGRAKPPWFACMLSLAGLLSVFILAYLAAYLPVAKPEWWGGKRPMEILPSGDVAPKPNPKKSWDPTDDMPASKLNSGFPSPVHPLYVR